MSVVHLLIDGYRQIACSSGDGAPSGNSDTSTISKVTCLACLNRPKIQDEALTEAIAVRLIEFGETKL